jgi:UDP-N-acetylmuramoyl-L-alanyl-D-glutamate--2,6-diaminopimelate ligase
MGKTIIDRMAVQNLAKKFNSNLSNENIEKISEPSDQLKQDILNQMQAGINPVDAKKTLRISDRKEAIRTAVAFAKEGDIILIAGKGHEKYQEINGIKHPCDDFEIVKEIFNN